MAPGPEGRQTIAQRVSAGFRPPHEHPAPAGRQNPFPQTNTSIRSRHQSTTPPRKTKRISRKASKPPSPQAYAPPARQTLAARVGIGIGIGIETQKEEPGPIPIHLGSLAPSKALAPGPEGRQTIAQRVSAGFRPHMNTQPREGRQNPFPHTNTSIRSRHQGTTTPRNTNRISRKASKPQSAQVDEQPARQTLAARVGIGIGIGIENSLMSSRAPLLPETHFTPRRRARRGWNTLFIMELLDARRGTAQTRDQSSGVGKQGGSHPSTPAGSGPADIPIHPDPSKWNCSSNARAGCSGPFKDFYGSLPLTGHGHRCPYLSKISRAQVAAGS
jgi:hypothetical protein